MTEIKILKIDRLLSYLQVTYKMTFTLPAVYGTGQNPIDGLDKIITSYPDSYAMEVIPSVGTVLTYTGVQGTDISTTLAQAKTFLQNKYASLRAILDGLTLSPLDSLSGLAWDGTNWNASSTVTDLPNQSTLCVTATGVAAAAITATLPAVAGKFHNILRIEITAYSTAVRTGSATPVIVTTTNLNGSPAFTFASAAAIGTTDVKTVEPNSSIKSALTNTVTTIVCPATAGIIWRVNIFYSVSE